MAFPSDYMPAPDVYAFTSKKKARDFARKKYDVELDPWSMSGVTHTLHSEKKTVCIVCITDVKDKNARAALLAHECVHVAKSWADAMDDDSPSEEFMAYATQCAFITCLDQLGERWL